MIRKTAYIGGRLFTVPQLISFTGQTVFLPFYHTVSDKYLPHIANVYTPRTIKQFENDIDFFCKYFTPVSIDELCEIANQNKKVQKPVFHLSFDDGLKECYSVVSPILLKKGIPATFFINTGFVDNQELFYRYKISLIIDKIKNSDQYSKTISNLLHCNSRDKIELINFILTLNYLDNEKINSLAQIIELDFQEFSNNNKPYMDKTNIRYLLENGFTIGSHSHSHPYFKDIQINDQKTQVAESFRFLESEFSISGRYFAFPFSDKKVTNEFILWLKETMNCKLIFGTSGMKQEKSKMHLHRVPMEMYPETAEKIIKSEYLYYFAKRLVNKNIILRK